MDAADQESLSRTLLLSCQGDICQHAVFFFRKTKSSLLASSSGSSFTSTFESGTSCVISRISFSSSSLL